MIADPFDELRPPNTGKEGRTVYSQEDLRKLLEKAIELDADVCRFIALSALAFFRTRELAVK